jgi:hypothetical protein
MAKAKNDEKPAGNLVIAILDRGWVFVARTRTDESATSLVLENAACVRYWGTTKGIGQLALEGPLRETKLDEAGTVTVPRTALIALIDADEDKWPNR